MEYTQFIYKTASPCKRVFLNFSDFFSLLFGVFSLAPLSLDPRSFCASTCIFTYRIHIQARIEACRSICRYLRMYTMRSAWKVGKSEMYAFLNTFDMHMVFRFRRLAWPKKKEEQKIQKKEKCRNRNKIEGKISYDSIVGFRFDW